MTTNSATLFSDIAGREFFSDSCLLSDTIVTHFHDSGFPIQFRVSLLDLCHIGNRLQQDQPAPSDLLSFLSPDEQNFWNKFSYKKRRTQWIGGRLAAKHAISVFLSPPSSQAAQWFEKISILPDQAGRPTLSTALLPQGQIPSLSLSHSDHCAIAIAADTVQCGIDIQKITDRIHNIQEKFLESEEDYLLAELCPVLTPTERLTLLWTAKEAVKKALLHDQPTMFSGIRLLRPALDSIQCLRLTTPCTGIPSTEVYWLKSETFMLAYTLGNITDA